MDNPRFELLTKECHSHYEGDVRNANIMTIDNNETPSQQNARLPSPTREATFEAHGGDARPPRLKSDRSRLDWSRHKGNIRRLYIDENRPLKEVMHLMEKEYDFIATHKSYKFRLKEWGFKKYVRTRDTDLQSILKPVGEDGSVATETGVKLADGRVISFDRMAQHLKRKRTPTQGQLLSLQHAEVMFYRYLEMVLADTRAYVSGKVLAGKKVDLKDDPEFLGSRGPAYLQLFSNTYTARDLLVEDKFDDALVVLRHAPTLLAQLLRAEPGRTLEMLFNIPLRLLASPKKPIRKTDIRYSVVPIPEERFGQVAKMVKALIRYTASISTEGALQMKIGHPLRRVLCCLSALSHAEDSSLYEIALRGYKMILRDKESSLPWPDRGYIVDQWLELACVQGFDVLPEGLEDTLLALYKKNREVYGEASREAGTVMKWRMLLELIRVENYDCPTDKLQRICEENLRTLPPFLIGSKRNAQLTLANIHHDMGRKDLAEMYLRDAIDATIEQSGIKEACVLLYTIKLQKWFEEWGDEAKVAEMQERREYYLGLIDDKAEDVQVSE